MAVLSIDDVQAEALGQNIVNSAATIASYLTEISTINNDIAAAWHGTDATTYCDRINTQVQELTKIKETISDTGVHLQNIAKAYRQVRDENSKYV